MKSKKCKDCKKTITGKTAVLQGGYVSTLCKPCKREETKKYYQKRKKALKGTWFERQ